ncbi:glycosyltransferase [Methylobacterium radiotolerans]|uniref:glycosyltransferase n=1 Tax=Methylobacterium radiotolerans TaxID=31998 RepID=UPI001FD930B8|nr:glycosyltransferase [Methylobacterium radiotolerans]
MRPPPPELASALHPHALHAALPICGLAVPGPLVGADLPAWYHGLDAFCSAEAHAGWCNPAAEAMACGTPLVTTVHGTLAFAEDAVTALVVPDGPDAALGAAVALAADRIVTDPAAAATRSEAGRARGSEEHTFVIQKNIDSQQNC